MATWWWIWLAIVFFLFIVPMAYGWGYRGWGPPYPTYYRRRRQRRATPPPSVPGPAVPDAGAAAGVPEPEPFGGPPAWGWLGDLVWLAFVIAVIWFLVAL